MCGIHITYNLQVLGPNSINSTQDGNPLGERENGPSRPAKDFIASGEAGMLAWFPPAGAHLVQPLSDSQTLVRVLGGLSTNDMPNGVDPSEADVV